MAFASKRADFNGDGITDMVWHGADGSLAIWNTGPGLYIPANGLVLKGFGDWNGDGTTDILWQSPTGATETWTMRDNHVAFVSQLGVLPPIQGIGDFDGNGRDDLLYERSPGAFNTASAEARKIPVSSLGIIAPFNPDYDFIGTGDFNGDGRDDMLFRGTGSVAGTFLIQQPVSVLDRPDQLETAPLPFADPGASWSVLGLADFDGDGKTDFLWQHVDGAGQVDARTMWLMGGTGGGLLWNPGADWSLVSTGDYNADGRADLTWHHTSGWNCQWLMDGVSVTGFGSSVWSGDFWSLGG